MTCSSAARAIQASLAFARLTHLCRADQPSQVLIVVFVLLVDPVLTWC